MSQDLSIVARDDPIHPLGTTIGDLYILAETDKTRVEIYELTLLPAKVLVFYVNEHKTK